MVFRWFSTSVCPGSPSQPSSIVPSLVLSPRFLYYFILQIFASFVTCWTCLAGRDRDRDSTLILAALPEIYDPHTHTANSYWFFLRQARTTIEIGNKMWTRMKNVQIMCTICVESGLWHLWLDSDFLWPFKKLLIFRCEIHLILRLPTIPSHTHTHTLVENCYVSVGEKTQKSLREREREGREQRRVDICQFSGCIFILRFFLFGLDYMCEPMWLWYFLVYAL